MDKLIQKLESLGFETYAKGVWQKVNPRNRDIITVTLLEDRFEKFVRCQPLKEGWTQNEYEYSDENIKNFMKLS